MFPGLRNAFGSSIHPKYSGEHFTHELLCAGLSSELPCPVSLQKLCGEHLGHISLDIASSLELPCSVRKQKYGFGFISKVLSLTHFIRLISNIQCLFQIVNNMGSSFVNVNASIHKFCISNFLARILYLFCE